MEAENAPTHIEVYIIRHGERTDEANVKENYRKEDERWNAVPADCFGSCPKPTFQQAVPTSLIHTPPECDTFDPLLTEKGHYQAQEAWKSVTDLIPSWKPVAIFSSPMRRAVGTAMMVGSVTTRWNSFPNPRSLADPKENESRNAVIPITIVNELGDFASAVERRGGAKELVPQSCIACAAMDRNNGDLASPFYQALMKMPSHKVPVASMDLVRKIQFW
jgi:Histidine phosphatase superfamily (branch 1)